MCETAQKFHKYALNALELDISLEFPGDFKAFKAYVHIFVWFHALCAINAPPRYNKWE